MLFQKAQFFRNLVDHRIHVTDPAHFHQIGAIVIINEFNTQIAHMAVTGGR